jgi:hypothetical protein
VNYWRALPTAVCVFIACFLVLKFWLDLEAGVAVIAAGVPAVVSFGGNVLGLIKTTLEIKKLQLENRKLQRDEKASNNVLHLPTVEEIDRYGLSTQAFIAKASEKKIHDK